MKNILKPTKIKIICNIFLSLALVLVVIFLPSAGLSNAFARLSLGQKLLSFLVSYVISFIFYYPLTASLVHLANSIKNSTYVFKEIFWVVIFIAIFNLLTLSLAITKISSVYVASNINQSSQTPSSDDQSSNQPICGLKINDFAAGSKAEAAGIKIGENILQLNGATINSIQDIATELENKKPGDKVSLETDQGLKTVELVPNISDPSRSALGLILMSNPCK